MCTVLGDTVARSSRRSNRDRSRVDNYNAPARRADRVYTVPRYTIKKPAQRAYKLAIEDRRRWDPNPLKPPRSRTGRIHTKRVDLPRRGIHFASPSTVMICVRRKIRRAVMFAAGGAGRAKMRKPRRNQHSNVRC